MRDVLTICIPTFPDGGSVYPSVNHLGCDGRRGGRKSPEFHALFEAVKIAAEYEMLGGWTTATYLVEVHLKRYLTTRKSTDSSNLGKCEIDALQAAGVVVNDSLVRLFADVQYDPSPGAIDRISLVVIRTFPPAILADKPARKPKPAAPRAIDPPYTFAECQAEARRRTAAKPRTLAEMKSGDVIKSFAERDRVLSALGIGSPVMLGDPRTDAVGLTAEQWYKPPRRSQR
jgi:hypothetical protein